MRQMRCTATSKTVTGNNKLQLVVKIIFCLCNMVGTTFPVVNYYQHRSNSNNKEDDDYDDDRYYYSCYNNGSICSWIHRIYNINNNCTYTLVYTHRMRHIYDQQLYDRLKLLQAYRFNCKELADLNQTDQAADVLSQLPVYKCARNNHSQ